MDNAKHTNGNWLADAAQILKGKGIIKRDKDIADMTGYSKESVSNMLSGRTAISNKFKTKFEEIFGKEVIPESDNESLSVKDLQAKYILRLERTVELLEDVNKLLREDNERLRKKGD